MDEEGKLQNPPKFSNPIAIICHYHAKRMFLASTEALFLDTKVE